MPTSGAATVSESELSDSSHSDIDESIQHNTKKARLGLFAAYISKKTAVSNMSMSTLSVRRLVLHCIDYVSDLAVSRLLMLIYQARNCGIWYMPARNIHS